MNITQKLKKSGKVKRCSCGRVILHVQTTKGARKSSHSKKEPRSTKVLRALTTLSKRVDSSDDATCSTASSSLLRSEPNQTKSAKKIMCYDCSQKSTQQDGAVCNVERKEEIPILQRLKVVKAANDSSESGGVRMLPREVVVVGAENTTTDNSESASELYTETSELGFDGISPSSMMDKKVPTRFTFDGIVPSKSSGDGDDVRESENISSDESETGTILNDLAESERSERKLKHTSQQMTKEKNLILYWNRTISTSEMSIEFSEADHFRTCGREEKDNISTRTATERDLAMVSTDFAIGDALEPSEKNQNTSSSWFDFSFLAIS
jgi:hypothetical protein